MLELGQENGRGPSYTPLKLAQSLPRSAIYATARRAQPTCPGTTAIHTGAWA
jgi:hypothetical protein